MQSALAVAVRIRPFLPSENGGTSSDAMEVDDSRSMAIGSFRAGRGTGGPKRIVRCVDESMLVLSPKPQRGFTKFGNSRSVERHMKFDRVYDCNSTQEEIYNTTAKPLLDRAMEGYNSTIFAYGATGCGKTHTVCGSPEDPGLIGRIVNDLYAKIGSDSPTAREVTLSLSYLQIYNEEIYDLLAPGVTVLSGPNSYQGVQPKGLQLREGQNDEMIVVNLSVHNPESAEDIQELIDIGNKNRAVDATHANAVSSRSHAVLMLRIHQREKSLGDQQHTLTSTLMIVDLAGNERAASTLNSGRQLKEGANINRSLLALAKCISALATPSKSKHVPFRDSKLTRLLKYSLGGNCRTAMVVCVSPSVYHYEETLNSLMYASCAKNIRTSAFVNQRSTEVHLANYQKRFAEQRSLIAELQTKLSEAEATTCQKLANALIPQLAVRNFVQPQELEQVSKQIASAKDPVTTVTDMLTTLLLNGRNTSPTRGLIRTPKRQTLPEVGAETGSEPKRRRWG